MLPADSAHTPQFVQSLAGRVHITAAALGRQHTLFLDSAGQAWATGENKVRLFTAWGWVWHSRAAPCKLMPQLLPLGSPQKHVQKVVGTFVSST